MHGIFLTRSFISPDSELIHILRWFMGVNYPEQNSLLLTIKEATSLNQQFKLKESSIVIFCIGIVWISTKGDLILE